jgi:lysophospholipase L1-like esterase
MKHGYFRALALGFATMICGAALAQQAAQPAPPGRAPAARPPATPNGQGPTRPSPRDQLPFSNSDLSKLDPKLPTLFIAGDSTSATGDPAHRGWAAVLVDYFDTSKINLANRAQGGINFPNFYTQRWPGIVEAMKPGDFDVVELGHNGGHLDGMGDQTREQPGRNGGPAQVVHTYGWYTRKFVTDAKAKGATPIVSSTSIRNVWENPNARFNEAYLISKTDAYDARQDTVERGMGRTKINGEGEMLYVARRVAAEEKVPFIDHANIAADLYEKLGRENTAMWHSDRTHFSTEGAIVQAELFIAGLRAQPQLKLNDYLNDKGKAIAPYRPAAR